MKNTAMHLLFMRAGFTVASDICLASMMCASEGARGSFCTSSAAADTVSALPGSALRAARHQGQHIPDSTVNAAGSKAWQDQVVATIAGIAIA
jgi:hypothetical protein